MFHLKLPFIDDKSKKVLMKMGIALFIVLVFVKYVCMFPFPKIVLLSLYVGIMLCCNRDELIASGVCLIPLTNVFNHNYALLICIMIYLVKYYKEIKWEKGIIAVLALCIWEAAHFFCVGFSIKGLVTFTLPYVFCLLLMYVCTEKVDYKRVIRIFAKCTLFISFVMFCKMLLDFDFDLGNAFYLRHRLGMNIDTGHDALTYNANSLGVFCVLGISGLVQFMILKQGKVEDYFVSFGLLISGLLTMSKTFILCLGVLLLLVWMVQKGKFKAKLRLGILAIAVIAFFAGVIAIILPEFFESFIGRFMVGDLTSGRVGLFIQYTQFIFSSWRNFLFGTGVNGIEAALKMYYGTSFVNVPHNGIQEIVVVWGVVGFFLFAMFIYYFFKQARSVNKQKLIHYFPFILIFIKVQLGQLVTTNYTLLMFALIYLSLCYDFYVPSTVVEEIIENPAVVIKDRTKMRLKKHWRKR